MRKAFVFFAVLAITAAGSPENSTAQKLKTQPSTNTQGKVVETPYVTRAELKKIRLRGPDGVVQLGDILSVASVDQITNAFGEPDSTNIRDINAGSYERSIRLFYEGMEITYMDYTEAAGETRLINLNISSYDHNLEVGGKEIRPGMPSCRFGRALRKNEVGNKGESTRSYLIRVAKEEETSSKKNEPELADQEMISIKVDRNTGKVIQVRYHTTV